MFLYYYFVDAYCIYYFTLDIQGQEYPFGATITPSGGTVISKTFQILYRNESIVLNDSFVFRLHMLVNSDKVNFNSCTVAIYLPLDNKNYGPNLLYNFETLAEKHWTQNDIHLLDNKIIALLSYEF